MAFQTHKPQPPRPRINSKSEASTISQPKPGKPSLFARYSALSFKVKLYIWITTAGAAWLADSVSDRIFEQNMIEEEANRRVEIELRKLKEAEMSGRNEK
jgi:hypothetical protein